ncbi:MAG: M48 family metallopeptidase [Verrucomicrobiota bacterium]|nr:M48 family metallopeptidase [Verrucomicrobiota bacterium]
MSDPDTIFAVVALGLILTRYFFELWLDGLNAAYARKHADEVPEAFQEIMDEATYKKSVRYTLAKARFGTVSDSYSTAVLCVLLFSGLLASLFAQVVERTGQSAWGLAVALWAVILLMSLLSLPFSWYSQFRLEERFGFNNSTQRTWCSDQVKGVALSFVIGVPLLALILWLVGVSGYYWWLWAWGVVVVFQLLMSVLAPIFILPLFNKFTPLPEGSLKDRLKNLAERTGFINAGIQVMDGSKRSKHSNAFFTGLGKGRRIALFDTLVEQMSEQELEAVLAHEIGHYKLRHVPKMITWSFVTTLAGFWGLSLLAGQSWFTSAFGFGSEAGIASAFLQFALLAGTVTFWLSPLSSLWSRKFEYEADAFAADAVNNSEPMITALRKLNRENLSNLTPHPWYSGFHYDHPALLERESALKDFNPGAA